MYGKLDLAKFFSFTEALSELKQGNMTVIACFNKLLALGNQLKAAEEKLEGPDLTLQQYKSIREREKVTRFLLILNETYLPFHSWILAMEPMSSLARFTNSLSKRKANDWLYQHTQESGNLHSFWLKRELNIEESLENRGRKGGDMLWHEH